MPALSDSAMLLLAPCALGVGALVQLFLAPIRSSRFKGSIATLWALPALASVILAIPEIRGGRTVDATLLNWDGPLAIALHVDALSVLFALMGTLLGAIVLLYSIGYMAHDRAATRFYATMLLFIGGFVGLVYSANLFLMYLFWELIGLCSFSLVGFWYKQREAVMGARKVLLMTHIAGYGLLAAVVLLYQRGGTAIWTDPAVAHSFSTGVFLLMLVALIAKSVQVPLHTWIPDAMAAPTPVSSLLHAACYVTAGVYLAARMHSFAIWPLAWRTTLISVACITMIVGVMYALVQTDLKRMLAFSTVSQIGYMLLGIAIGTPLGIMAGLLHCLNHGFFKGGLFLNAGAVQHAAHTRDMNQLGGLAQLMPRTTLCWLVGVGNMAGIPLMSGFVSKWMLYAAALQAGWAVPAVIAWMVSLGTVFVCAKATSAVFLGPTTEATHHAHEAASSMQWAMGLMAAGSIVLGVAPQIAVVLFFNPMLNALGLDASMRVTWLGMFSGAGSFSTAGGLMLAIVSFVLGGAVYWLARGSHPVHVTHAATVGSGGVLLTGPGDVFTGGEPLWDHNRLTAGDFSRIFEQNWKSFFRWTNVDRFYLNVWYNLRLIARYLAHPVAWLERHALTLVLIGAAALLVIFGFEHPALSLAEHLPAPTLPALLLAAVSVAGAALVYAAAVIPGNRWLAVQLAFPTAFAIAACMQHGEITRLILLECASLLSIVPVWMHAHRSSTRILYLSVVLVSGLCLSGSQLLTDPTEYGWGRALLFTGVCIKLAAIPFIFWLLRLADELHPLILGTILAVIDMTAVGELYLRVQSDPAVFTPPTVWLTVAVLTSLVAGLLMLAQRNLKRLLVLSSIEDIGFLLLGIASLSALGLNGVLFATASHAIAKTLLFVAIALPECEHADESTHAALAVRYPYSAFAFLVGMLAMLGVPPTLGFIGRWKLYEAALQLHPALIAGFILASVLALIAYVRAFTTIWWGPPPGSNHDEEPVLPAHEPFSLRAVLVVLCALICAAGLWPNILLALIPGGRP